MATSWQQGLRGTGLGMKGENAGGLKSSNNFGGLGNGKIEGGKITKRRAALGDISNRTSGQGNNGFGGPKAKKSLGYSKPSFTIATENDNNRSKVGRSTKSNMKVNGIEEDKDEKMDMSILEEGEEETKMAVGKSIHQTPLPEVDPCDENDLHNPKYAAEYVGQIYTHLRQCQNKYVARPDYMDMQSDISIKMRALLVDWLIQVHIKFELLPQTLYLTINLLDRFLSKRDTHRSKLQLVGCACMLLASKYEEIYAPECCDFVNMSDKAFDIEDILDMESVILNVLEFNLTTPSAYTFLRRYMKVSCSTAKTQHMATFLVERSLQEYGLLLHSASLLAASALYIAQECTDPRRTWNSVLKRHTQYSYDDMEDCIDHIKMLYTTNNKDYLQAVNKKYSSSKYMNVSAINFT